MSSTTESPSAETVDVHVCQWSSLLTALVVYTFIGHIILIVLPAAFGISLGLRKLYMNAMLRVFEFGKEMTRRHIIERNQSFNDLCQLNHPVPENMEADIIEKEVPPDIALSVLKFYNESPENLEQAHKFQLSDAYYFCKSGIEAIVDDEVTKRFAAEELPSWNLLTRTNNISCTFISLRLTILWFTGFIFRYLVLLPVRLMVTLTGLSWFFVITTVISILPDFKNKKSINSYVCLTCYRILSRGFSAIITYHDRENRAKGGGICVANHTSPIDVIILGSDNCFAMVGQSHGGFTGYVQRGMSRTTSHIWFERNQMNDRKLVTERLREHVEDTSKLPILIFPEGTCINNTSVMMFKKGSFDVGGTIYPVAIKYDQQFGDAFWDSSKHGMVFYLLMMMTSWAIVCHVWYLPPVTRRREESAIQFASRVKADIAGKGGLVDSVWDGQLKRTYVKESFRVEQQEKFSKLIKLG